MPSPEALVDDVTRRIWSGFQQEPLRSLLESSLIRKKIKNQFNVAKKIQLVEPGKFVQEIKLNNQKDLHKAIWEAHEKQGGAQGTAETFHGFFSGFRDKVYLNEEEFKKTFDFAFGGYTSLLSRIETKPAFTEKEQHERKFVYRMVLYPLGFLLHEFGHSLVQTQWTQEKDEIDKELLSEITDDYYRSLGAQLPFKIQDIKDKIWIRKVGFNRGYYREPEAYQNQKLVNLNEDYNELGAVAFELFCSLLFYAQGMQQDFQTAVKDFSKFLEEKMVKDQESAEKREITNQLSLENPLMEKFVLRLCEKIGWEHTIKLWLDADLNGFMELGQKTFGEEQWQAIVTLYIQRYFKEAILLLEEIQEN